jgi:hypothetical protein
MGDCCFCIDFGGVEDVGCTTICFDCFVSFEY